MDYALDWTEHLSSKPVRGLQETFTEIQDFSPNAWFVSVSVFHADFHILVLCPQYHVVHHIPCTLQMQTLSLLRVLSLSSWTIEIFRPPKNLASSSLPPLSKTKLFVIFRIGLNSCVPYPLWSFCGHYFSCLIKHSSSNPSSDVFEPPKIYSVSRKVSLTSSSSLQNPSSSKKSCTSPVNDSIVSFPKIWTAFSQMKTLSIVFHYLSKYWRCSRRTFPSVLHKVMQEVEANHMTSKIAMVTKRPHHWPPELFNALLHSHQLRFALCDR